jgi:hypothetical protein
MLHGAGDAVQLPDELFELFRTAKVQVAVPQKADGQDDENRQADGQRGEYDGEKQRVEGCEGLDQWGLQERACEGRIQQRGSGDNESISGQRSRLLSATEMIFPSLGSASRSPIRKCIERVQIDRRTFLEYLGAVSPISVPDFPVPDFPKFPGEQFQFARQPRVPPIH